jgi:hypothetical protein
MEERVTNAVAYSREYPSASMRGIMLPMADRATSERARVFPRPPIHAINPQGLTREAFTGSRLERTSRARLRK